jgi:hypothetical protein
VPSAVEQAIIAIKETTTAEAKINLKTTFI